jgi:hypothetical protein
MPSPTDFPARGKVIAVQPDRVTFAPQNTNYEFHLETGGAAYGGPANVPVNALIRVVARKLWTVPSGGNFVSPIFGPPRTIQGRVRYASETELVVQAGTNFVVALPKEMDQYDLTSGDIAVGALVNVVAMPGARIEFLPSVGPQPTESQPVVVVGN